MIKVTKKGNKAWVTFTIPADENTKSANITGEWSQWKEEPMRQKKNGDFFITKVLKTGQSYQFGYKINKHLWSTEDTLPKVSSPYGSKNSIISL